MLKRIADWLEKVSVACIVVGLFQDKPSGFVLGTASLVICLILTFKERRK